MTTSSSSDLPCDEKTDLIMAVLKAGKHPQAAIPSTESYKLPRNKTADLWMDVLSQQTSDAPSQYLRDRDAAFRWYREMEFPQVDYRTELGFGWHKMMAEGADKKGIWKEAWASFHHALAGSLALERPKDIPVICLYLGRAHTGQQQYSPASLYLEAGLCLAERQHSAKDAVLIVLEEAVLAGCEEPPDHFQSALDRAFTYLFPSGREPIDARNIAFVLFEEGRKNQEWRDKSGQPINSCLVHATGYYRVSLALNRKLRNKQGVAFNLANLGDVWRKRNRKDSAIECWREAIPLFVEIGDQDRIELLEQWMNDTCKNIRGDSTKRELGSPFTTYTNVFCNFSLVHPSDWKVEFENRGVADSQWTETVRLVGPMGSAARPYLTVVTGLVKNDGKSLAAYMDKAEQDLRNGFSNLYILSKRESTLLGCPTAWMTYTYQGNSGLRQEMNVTTFFGREWLVWFQFICETDVRQSSNDFPIFERIVRSLRINSGGLRLDANLVGPPCGKCGRPGSAGNYPKPVFDPVDGNVMAVCDRCWKAV